VQAVRVQETQDVATEHRQAHEQTPRRIAREREIYEAKRFAESSPSWMPRMMLFLLRDHFDGKWRQPPLLQRDALG
jgi:hypothetical protein